jgi:hypothetical protein
MAEFTVKEASRRLGISRGMVQRIAQSQGLGMMVSSGPVSYRVLSEEDLQRLQARKRIPGPAPKRAGADTLPSTPQDPQIQSS